MKFNKKGQGALEYLLLIGGAVLIAVIVIALLVGMGSSGRQTTQQNANTTNQIVSGSAIAPILNSASCDAGPTPQTMTINFTSSGGTIYLMTNDTNETAITPAMLGSNGTVTLASSNLTRPCKTPAGTQTTVKLRAVTASGSTADSNPIIVTTR